MFVLKVLSILLVLSAFGFYFWAKYVFANFLKENLYKQSQPVEKTETELNFLSLSAQLGDNLYNKILDQTKFPTHKDFIKENPVLPTSSTHEKTIISKEHLKTLKDLHFDSVNAWKYDYTLSKTKKQSPKKKPIKKKSTKKPKKKK